jgi:hypothetical protein
MFFIFLSFIPKFKIKYREVEEEEEEEEKKSHFFACLRTRREKIKKNVKIKKLKKNKI